MRLIPEARAAEREAAMTEILNVKNLSVRIGSRKPLTAVSEVSFTVRSGECFALVGESGCGKSLTALSLMRLLPEGLHIAGGEVLFKGRDLLRITEAQMQSVRGARLAMIFQEPATSLNPVMTVGEQIIEAVRLHESVPKAEARERALQWPLGRAKAARDDRHGACLPSGRCDCR